MSGEWIGGTLWLLGLGGGGIVLSDEVVGRSCVDEGITGQLRFGIPIRGVDRCWLP